MVMVPDEPAEALDLAACFCAIVCQWNRASTSAWNHGRRPVHGDEKTGAYRVTMSTRSAPRIALIASN